MSDDMKQLAQRVLDLDAQATDRVWIPWITRDADEDNEWIATSSCHTSDEAQARRDAALIAEYRTAAPDLARALVAEQARSADLERQLAALTDERDDLKAQRDAMRADVPVDEQLLGHLAMTGIAKSHDAYKAQKRAEVERDEALSKLAAERERSGDAEARYTTSIRAHEATAQERDALRADLARVTAERDEARVCCEREAMEHAETRMERDAARQDAEALRALLRECRAHAVGYAPESLVAKMDAALSAPTPVPELARNQPCGCVVCVCEGETQCFGCGAKNCGTHPVGQMPNPVYALPPAPAPDALAAKGGA